mgnify:FL=1
MVGIPASCNTKADWENAVEYAVVHNTGKGGLKSRLEHLRDDHYKLVLKESSKDVPVEEQTADDYEKVEDPAAEKNKLAVSDEWINTLIAKLS